MSSATPMVSVLLCTNRVDELLARSIDSLRAQTHTQMELVVVLNGAAVARSNEVEVLLEGFGAAKLLTSDVAHLNHSLNLGLDAAAGELVARMDADDIAYPDRLTEQVKFLLEHPEVSVCGSWYALIDGADRPFREVRLPCSDAKLRAAAFYSNPICHPSVMFRRADVIRLGGYLGGLFAEDYDLWLRMMLDSDVKFATLPRVLLGYRASPTGAARRSKRAYAAMSAAQWNCFTLTGDPRWLMGALASLCKRVIRARAGD
ncbi:MAG: glycosyltransferase [Ramlibacter sp.]